MIMTGRQMGDRWQAMKLSQCLVSDFPAMFRVYSEPQFTRNTKLQGRSLPSNGDNGVAQGKVILAIKEF